MEGGRVAPDDVQDQDLKEAITLVESKGFYVVRYPDRNLRFSILKTLSDQPQDLHVITKAIYGQEANAKDQYRVRSCLRRMRDAGIVMMDGTVLIGRTYVGKWRLV